MKTARSRRIFLCLHDANNDKIANDAQLQNTEELATIRIVVRLGDLYFGPGENTRSDQFRE